MILTGHFLLSVGVVTVTSAERWKKLLMEMDQLAQEATSINLGPLFLEIS